MDSIEIYLLLWGVSLVVALFFNRTSIPIPLMLVITGMFLAFIPGIPELSIQPKLVLDFFIPLLVYAASTDLSWKDFRFNLRPIILLSVGHVFFITILVAVSIHALLPALGWPLSFVLGAIIAPPDDVAILAVADKIAFPHRVITILKGESLLNDATALVLFRFSLAVVLTSQFSPTTAISAFFLVVLGETMYGFILGHLIGQLRLRIKDPMLQMMASVITPFLAYFPPEMLGGCGILAVVITGFIIGHRYIENFPPEVRLTNRSVWNSLSFSLQSIIFLLVGLNFKYTLHGIASIPLFTLVQSTAAIILTVVLGRFAWVYLGAYLPRFLFPSILKKDPYPPWQLPFLVSWAGMRGVISLAAVLAIPFLPTQIEGANPKDLLTFWVFTVITFTLLLQGLSLPWVIKKLGLHCYGLREKYDDHLSELNARVRIAKKVLHWLLQYKKEIKGKEFLKEKVDLRIQEYQLRSRQLSNVLSDHHRMESHEDSAEQIESSLLSAQINELERHELLKLWHENKISHAVKNKILHQLDHRFKHITG